MVFALVVMAHLQYQAGFPVVYSYFPTSAACLSKLHQFIEEGATPRGACLRRDWMQKHGMKPREYADMVKKPTV